MGSTWGNKQNGILKYIFQLSYKQNTQMIFVLPESSNRALEPAGSPVPFNIWRKYWDWGCGREPEMRIQKQS